MNATSPEQLLIANTNLVDECVGFISEREYEDALQRQKSIEESSSFLLPFCYVTGFVCSAFCLLLLSLTAFAIHKDRLPSRKYTVISSRSVGDGFSSLLIAMSTVLSSPSKASPTLLALFICLSTFGASQISLSHLLVLVLRQISLVRPHGFSSLFSLRNVLISLALVWTLSLLYAAAFAPLADVIINPSRGPAVCSYSGCQLPLFICSIVVISVLLLVLLSFYLFILLKLRRTAVSFRFYGDSALAKKQLYRFLSYGVHLVVYIAISALQLAGLVILLQNASLYNRLRNDEKSCEIIEYLGVRTRVEAVAGGAILLWLVRIFADIVIVCLREHRKLLPWIAARDEQQGKRLSERSNSRADQRASFNCPVFSLEKDIHRTELRN